MALVGLAVMVDIRAAMLASTNGLFCVWSSMLRQTIAPSPRPTSSAISTWSAPDGVTKRCRR
jgi:hypothetical protein